VAEFCLGLMITASKRVYWLADHVRRGHWSKEGLDIFGPPFEIYRQKVGIIGASFVGRKLLELLGPMECELLLYDPYCTAEEARTLGATKVQTLEEIFSQCRVVSLNAPVTAQTAGMIRGAHFALLGPGSLFINTARGVIVNQQEMVKELSRGRFVACLDVTSPEPPELDDALRRLPNVLLTPHIAGAMAENLARIGEFVAEEIASYCAGRPLRGEVKREQLETIA
jgi:phosphoglycerate dehydrogenase-like enzyme